MAKAKGTFSRKAFRLLKRLGILGYSKKKNIFGVHPLVVSTAYIVLTLLLAAVSRKLVKSIFGSSESIFKQILLEFIATLELCAACFELIIVADNWGVAAYAIYLFLLTIWWSSHWEDASACPYSPIEDVLEGGKTLKTVVLVIVAQVFAALVTFSYVQVLWALELADTHRGRAFEECTADLQVDMVAGAIIEGVATCICRLISRTLSESNAKFGTVLDAFFGTMMVVAAFNFSGGYFNPALATALKLGCEGNTFTEHLVVYWLGATVGSILSVFIFKIKPIQNYVKKLKEKQE
ncbi:aquaporin-11 [Anoplophora glabripennis]|uniref:aquaporin-11 n=1 Tax=Anoplophora glabripennis TaxID=217634 RepID=UPI000874DE83|nr:aquaporin-11 [Anoplophora glabripennis]